MGAPSIGNVVTGTYHGEEFIGRVVEIHVITHQRINYAILLDDGRTVWAYRGSDLTVIDRTHVAYKFYKAGGRRWVADL